MREGGLDSGCSPESAGVLSLNLGSLGRSWGKSGRKRRARGLCEIAEDEETACILKGPGVGLWPISEAGAGFSESFLASSTPHCLCWVFTFDLFLSQNRSEFGCPVLTQKSKIF